MYPKGLNLQGADYPVVESLPGILLRRKTNRGFEGLAQLPGGDLVLAVQSPLSVPDTAAGEESRNARLLRFSPKQRAVTAEYAYRFDAVDVVDPGEDDTSELKISSLVAVGPPTACWSRSAPTGPPGCSRVTLPHGAGILGGAWDDPATSPSYEQLDDPSAGGVPFSARAWWPTSARSRACPARSKASRWWAGTLSRSSTTTTSA